MFEVGLLAGILVPFVFGSTALEAIQFEDSIGKMGNLMDRLDIFLETEGFGTEEIAKLPSPSFAPAPIVLGQAKKIPTYAYNGASVPKYFFAGTKAERPESEAELEVMRQWARQWITSKDRKKIDDNIDSIRFYIWNYNKCPHNKFNDNEEHNYGAEVSDPSAEQKSKCIDVSAKKTIVYFHGFTGSAHSMGPIIQGFDDAGTVNEYNFIAVDWRKLAAWGGMWSHWLDGYILPQHATADVGIRAAMLLETFVKVEGINQGTIHAMGHSLGAHAVGLMCRAFRARTGFEIVEMTALDPAGPGYVCEALNKLPGDHDNYACDSLSGKTAGDKAFVNWAMRSSDATYVQAVHTDGGFGGSYLLSGHLGVSWANGDVDWFINGGTKQPSCDSWMVGASCNHHVALAIMQSLVATTESSKSFMGRHCGNQYDTDKSVSCSRAQYSSTHTVPWRFSYSDTERPFGLWFVKTAKDAPYYLQHW